MSYQVYVNTRQAARKARVHFSHCSHCNHGEGTHNRPPNEESYWSPRFDTFADAITYAQSTDMSVSTCKHCNPQSA